MAHGNDTASDLPSRHTSSGPPRKGLSIALGVVAFAAAVWLLREISAVAMPTFFALLLALSVWPLVRWVHERTPRSLKWLGAVTGLLLVVLILLVFLTGLGLAMRQVYELVRELGPELRQTLNSLPLPDILFDGPDADSDALLSRSGLASGALTALGITASTAGGIVVILFLMLLMLTEAENWHRKTVELSGERGENRWREIARSVGAKFRAYFTTRFLLGSITAVLYVSWLAVFGVDYLLLWGILAVLLNFVPTIGSIVAGTLPVLYALVTRDIATAAIVAGGLLVIEQVMGNFVDPRVMGHRLATSPLVVLVSLLFWSILWGIPGALLAVPLTVLITMVAAHFEQLKPVALLLTDCSTLEELDRHSHPKA